MKLDFSAPAEVRTRARIPVILQNRGLLNANVDVGVTVPQGVMGALLHQVSDRWAVLGSLGWQQWSKFGKAELSVDASNPTGLTTDL